MDEGKLKSLMDLLDVSWKVVVTQMVFTKRLKLKKALVENESDNGDNRCKTTFRMYRKLSGWQVLQTEEEEFNTTWTLLQFQQTVQFNVSMATQSTHRTW